MRRVNFTRSHDIVNHPHNGQRMSEAESSPTRFCETANNLEDKKTKSKQTIKPRPTELRPNLDTNNAKNKHKYVKGAGNKNSTGYKKQCEEETTTCILCNEQSDDAWIQCLDCSGWARQECANVEKYQLSYHCYHCAA